MSNLNLTVMINAHEGSGSSIEPTKSYVRWTNDMIGLDISNPRSQTLQVAASGEYTITCDATDDVLNFIYLESSKKVKLEITFKDENDADVSSVVYVNPLSQGTNLKPGIYTISAEMTAVKVVNLDASGASTVFFVVGE